MNLGTIGEVAGQGAIPDTYVAIPWAYHMKKPILLIEDDRPYRQALRLYLESHGFTAKEAEDGREALVLLDGGLDVDIIISDYHMPVINGLDFLKALSYRVKGQDVRVILVSGNMTKEIEKEAKQAGAFALLSKPFDFQDLLALVSRAGKQ
ncbi:response regulator [Nitrospira sp. T9]|uniref:response regulator n=1 Tax=unclassified Nitrospira TaxID=2652172 RepID=UPI003F99026A